MKTYDTPIGDIEKKYGVTFDVPSDTKLGDFLKQKGYPSLAKMLKGKKRK